MKFRWSLMPAQPLLAGQLASSLKISPLLAQCLLNRELADVGSIRSFLQPRLKELADPFLLPNISAAVDRLFQARERSEQVLVFGDYDVDGVTSTALLLEVLRTLGWVVDYYLPHRVDEGYGLSQEAVENCLKKAAAKVLVAVDCGSTSVGAIAWLNERGIDVLVLDHHQVSCPAPAAFALVNPQLKLVKQGSTDAGNPGTARSEEGKRAITSDFTELCSVGLSFKLAHAIIKRGRQIGLAGAFNFDLRPLLDLVALGTISDLVPLVRENRILVSAGLERLNSTQRPGLIALKRVAQCTAPLAG